MPPSIYPHRRRSLAYLSGFWSLIILLVLSSGPAYAEWMEIGTSGEGNQKSTNYIDVSKIQRDGTLAKIWVLYNYTATQTFRGKPYLSIKGQRQYECRERTWRILAAYLYSEHMGGALLQRLSPAHRPRRQTNLELWQVPSRFISTRRLVVDILVSYESTVAPRELRSDVSSEEAPE